MCVCVVCAGRPAGSRMIYEKGYDQIIVTTPVVACFSPVSQSHWIDLLRVQ